MSYTGVDKHQDPPLSGTILPAPTSTNNNKTQSYNLSMREPMVIFTRYVIFFLLPIYCLKTLCDLYSKLGIISFISLILSTLYLAIIFAVHQSFFVELDGALVVTCLDGMLRHLAANAKTNKNAFQ